MDENVISTEMYSEMFETVKTLESDLGAGGGQDLGIGGSCLKSLNETRIDFGNPRATLVQLTPRLFESVGLQLNEIIKQQMREQMDFYYMTMMVNLFGSPGTQFDDLSCELDFGPKGIYEPIIQLLFPTTEWKEVISYGGGLTLGLDASLGWKANLNVSDVQLTQLMANLPGALSASISNKNEYNSWIAIPAFKFSIGRKDISAVGQQNSICRWIITRPELHQQDDVEFGVVFKLPKNGGQILELEGKVTAQPSLSWLAANLRHVWNSLPAKFKRMIDGKAPTRIGRRVGWNDISLPQ